MTHRAKPVKEHKDLRPRAWCSRTHTSFLIDSGAAVSVFPRDPEVDVTPDPAVSLRAVNGSVIPTFGRKTIRMQFGNAHFTHTFVIASINSAVAGWDFLQKFRLNLIWQRNGQCRLGTGKRSVKLTMEPVKQELLGLQVAEFQDFREYSQAKKVTEQGIDDIPPAYEAMLEQLPGIDTPDFTKTPAHGVVHTINTGDHPPCRAKVRRLLPGSPKEVKGRQKWMSMEEAGIITRIKANETTTWSTALHLAPKPDGDYRSCGDFNAANVKF